jgi:Na+/proline symporter
MVCHFISSSLSTILNSLPSVILEDFLFSCCSVKLSDWWEQVIAKGLVLFFGVLAVACLYIVEPLEDILEVKNSELDIYSALLCIFFF